MNNQQTNAEKQLNSEAKKIGVTPLYYLGEHPFFVFETEEGWALTGIVDDTLIRLLPRLTASAVYDKFVELVTTRK